MHRIIILSFLLIVRVGAISTMSIPQATPYMGKNIFIHNVNYNGQAIDMASLVHNPLLVPAPSSNVFIGQEIKQWCTQHPFRIIVGCSVIAYGTLLLKVLMLEYNLKKLGYWSRWKETVDFDGLLAIPRKELMQELYRGMLQCYTQQEQSNKYLLLITCINAVEKEIGALNQLQHLYEWIAFGKLSFFFPGTHSSQFFSDKKRRLLYIKNLIVDLFCEDYQGTSVKLPAAQ